MQSAYFLTWCCFASLACLAVPCFSHCLKNAQFLKKKVVECKMYVFVFCTTFVWNISHLRRTQRYVIINVCTSSCEIPCIIVRFLEDVNFLDRLSKSPQIPNFIKICQLRSELSHADRLTGTTKLIVAFRYFANAPKSSLFAHVVYLFIIYNSHSKQRLSP